MSQPWMPLYIADYLADTSHLSAGEHGAYLMLIMHYWRQGSLPSDEGMLQRISRMTAREWAKSRAVISSFFDHDWKHERIENELAKAELKSASRSESGGRGGRAKALKDKERAIANASGLLHQNGSKALPSSSQPQSEKKDTSASRSSDGSEIAIDAKPKSKRISAESDQALLDGVTDIFNGWARAHGSPQVIHLTGQRAIHCRRRIAELMAHGYQTADEAFRFLLSKVDESFFVRGSPRKPLEFKQLLNEEFVARMIEGSFKYQPKQAGQRQWAS